MYYVSAILLILFKIPPKNRAHFRRLAASLAKRGWMRTYERIIIAYDRDIQICSYSDCREATFEGSGFSTAVLNSYRKLMLKEQVLFEKIYFNERKKIILFFRDTIQPQLIEQGVKTARLVRLNEGDKLFATYFEYFDLKTLDSDEYLEKATDVAARIVKVNLSESTDIPNSRLKYNKNTFTDALENLQNELEFRVPDISNLLSESDIYISRYVKRCLNHGDLSDKNTFKEGKVIDWDNFGWYPIGYDFGLIIGLSTQSGLTLEEYLQIEQKLYHKVSDLIQLKDFQISLAFFTAVFIRSQRVTVRYQNQNINTQLSRELVQLLNKRLLKAGVISDYV
ncbi:hypothetical protein DYD21_19670 [Rhodohalobacter sp. SW132]|uniref:phosphotransferase n=1 Tax=Rhodohalobacter sp. SW132 TaxID=2293433 RepID=UPI000E24176D|nr:phosphotransferase [Rhodohalobacter sp. SW132]REL24201.1 hypothetical protein DYD21_19670 [Rhodohalobacter sp. SW132]